jgi:DNA-binding NarL/FixJ family response regulator
MILEKAPGFAVVGEAADGRETVVKVVELKPDVVVLDIHMPLLDGLSACRLLLDAHPKVKVVVLSSDAGSESAQQALESGASGYVVKEAAGEELIRAIRTVLTGRLYLCPEIATELIRSRGFQGIPKTRVALTERDRELLRMIAAGLRNKEIASSLGLSVKAVEANRSRLMAKLDCRSMAELVRFAVREGIAPA